MLYTMSIQGLKVDHVPGDFFFFNSLNATPMYRSIFMIPSHPLFYKIGNSSSENLVGCQSADKEQKLGFKRVSV